MTSFTRIGNPFYKYTRCALAKQFYNFRTGFFNPIMEFMYATAQFRIISITYNVWCPTKGDPCGTPESQRLI